MPSLRCPNCYYATSFKKNEIDNAACSNCMFDLFNYYYNGRNEAHIETFIAEENIRLKKEKAKRDRAGTLQPSVDKVTESKTKKIIKVAGWILVILVVARMFGVEDYIDKYKAEQAGFSSVDTYKKALVEGFNTGDEYAIHLKQLEAKSLGFASIADMDDAKSRGFTDFQTYEKANKLGIKTAAEYATHLKQLEAKSLGFASIADMDDAKSRGFTDAASVQEAQNLGLQTYAELEQHREEVKRNQSCVYNWKACSDNSDLVNNYRGITSAKTSCELAVERGAKFGTPDWGGWLRSSFGTFYTGNRYIEEGTVTLIEPNVKLQNGFGAMVKSEVECHYDLERKEVLFWRVTK